MTQPEYISKTIGCLQTLKKHKNLTIHTHKLDDTQCPRDKELLNSITLQNLFYEDVSNGVLEGLTPSPEL